MTLRAFVNMHSSVLCALRMLCVMIQLCAMVDAEQWDSLMQLDQLRAMQVLGKAFTGFTEAPYMFPPTFKVKRTLGFTYNVCTSRVRVHTHVHVRQIHICVNVCAMIVCCAHACAPAA